MDFTLEVLLSDVLIWVEVVRQSRVVLLGVLFRIGIVVPCTHGRDLCLPQQQQRPKTVRTQSCTAMKLVLSDSHKTN